MSPNLKGALFMVASMAAFTVNDTLLKLIGGSIPLFQLLFLRSLLTSGLILLLRRQLGAIHFAIARRDWVTIGCRALAEVSITYFFLTALFNMPLANVVAVIQVVPLVVTLGSALFFAEAVGWRRMIAIGIGFAGVMLIVRPGGDGFTYWSLYALIAVLGIAARDLLTRRLSKDVPSATVTLVTAISVAAATGLASLGTDWVTIAPVHWVFILGSAISILGGYYFSIQTIRVGDVSYTAPFRYSGLVWALMLGWFVFGDWPDPLTFIGAGIVVATGVFTFYRERQVANG